MNDDRSDSFFADPNNSVGYLCRIAFRSFSRAMEMRTQPHGVSSGQWRFLRVLWREDGITQREDVEVKRARIVATIGKRWRMLAREGSRDVPQIGIRLRQGDMLPQSADDANRHAESASARSKKSGRFEWIGNVNVHGLRNAQRGIVEVKFGREHADHRRGPAIEA